MMHFSDIALMIGLKVSLPQDLDGCDAQYPNARLTCSHATSRISQPH